MNDKENRSIKSPSIRCVALAVPQTTGLVGPVRDTTNGGMLEITTGISRRGTGLSHTKKCDHIIYIEGI